eukprot:TRINITY_DN9274_c0_g1_i1.p1 TRINITY_DN9274_c0_g1~~TRINITY_DN9274_c0_g1_i1.p1  ORF type:complete len:296 (+),score=51.49 TRINITY_DN9274_c0_g1_i1:289-1176(+)
MPSRTMSAGQTKRKGPWHCDLCNKDFMRREHLNRHNRQHKDTNRRECPICDRPFFRSDHYQFHLRSHANAKVKPYQCGDCNRRYLHKYSLRRHHATSKHTKVIEHPVNIDVDQLRSDYANSTAEYTAAAGTPIPPESLAQTTPHPPLGSTSNAASSISNPDLTKLLQPQQPNLPSSTPSMMALLSSFNTNASQAAPMPVVSMSTLLPTTTFGLSTANPFIPSTLANASLAAMAFGAPNLLCNQSAAATMASTGLPGVTSAMGINFQAIAAQQMLALAKLNQPEASILMTVASTST